MSEARGYSVSSTHKKSVSENAVTSVLAEGEIPIYERELTADEEVLAALGYKPEFKREFSLWTSFSVSFAVLGLLPSFAATLYYGMGYAGTPGMVWGWLIAVIFINCVAFSMAEVRALFTYRRRYPLANSAFSCAPQCLPRVDSITLLQFWRLPDMVHLLLGSLDGQIG